MKAADILAVIGENEALKDALAAERAERLKWFDIALARSGTISSMAGEISVLKNQLAAKGGAR